MFCNPNINLISRTAEKCVHRKEGETGNYAGEIERREKMELVGSLGWRDSSLVLAIELRTMTGDGVGFIASKSS